MKTDTMKFASDIADLVAAAEQYRMMLAPDRIRAMEYYEGVMSEIQDRGPGWSRAVSRDVAATQKKLIPSIMRVVFGNETVAEFTPNRPEATEGAEQATDWVNLVALKRSNAKMAFYDALNDAAKMRNGVFHVYVDERATVTGGTYTGLDEIALAQLVGEDEVTVLEKKINQTDADDGLVYDVKIKRVERDRQVKIRAIPPEDYLIHPIATDSQEDAPLVGLDTTVTKSDLISMGYDAEKVESLPEQGADATQTGERFIRRLTNVGLHDNSPTQDELKQIRYLDIYVRLDYDGDGIAELRRVVMAGGVSEENILVNEYAEFVPFYDLVIERRPHQWEGVSIFDWVGDIQLQKTAIRRAQLDNVYTVSRPTPWYNIDKIINTDAVFNPEPGRPVQVKNSENVSDAYGYHEAPFIADKLQVAMEYLDKQISDRTGIDNTSAGLPDDALQNVTAKATALMEQKGIAQTEMIVQTVADCFARAIQGFLRMTIQHTDKSEIMKLRGKFVEIDPRQWDADMDVTINTGLGAGTRERDMAVMGHILQIQNQLVTMWGPNSPILKPDNIYNALAKSIQAAGIKDTSKYFTKPDPQEVQAAIQAQANKPNPDLEKIQAKGQVDIQLAQVNAQTNAQSEQARTQADIIVKKHAAETDAALKERIAQIEASKHDVATQAQLALEAQKQAHAEKLHTEKLAHDALQAHLDREHELAKVTAQAVGDGMTRNADEANAPAQNAGPKLLEVMDGLHKSLNAKKIIKRDANGDIIGLELAKDNAA